VRNDLRTRYRARMADAAQALLDKRRAEAIVMLESCGVRPKDVPLDVDFWRIGPRVFLEQFVRDDETGNIRVRKDRTGVMVEAFWIEPQTVPDWIPPV
jgi:hypothetical protein